MGVLRSSTQFVHMKANGRNSREWVCSGLLNLQGDNCYETSYMMLVMIS